MAATPDSPANDNDGFTHGEGKQILVPRECAEELERQMARRALASRLNEKIAPQPIGGAVDTALGSLLDGVKKVPKHLLIQLERAEQDVYWAKRRMRKFPNSHKTAAYIVRAEARLAAIKRTLDEGGWYSGKPPGVK